MDEPSPARLYATLAGATLVVAGILGFFYSSSFGTPGDVDKAFGIFAVNGWDNVLHILTGALGLLVAGYAARQYALGLGAFYVIAALWGFALGSGESVLALFPIDTGDNVAHLLLGALGIAAALATPASEKRAATTA
jgi:hypothetical protein